MKKRINPKLLWFLLGLISSALLSLIVWVTTLFTVVPFANIVLIVFAVLGILPGILAVFGLRFMGLIGVAGIVVGILWGFGHCFFTSIPWQYVFILDYLRVYSVFMVIAGLVQIFILYFFQKKTSAYKRNKRYGVDSDTLMNKIDQSRYYEV